jgi:hypothetical protein
MVPRQKMGGGGMVGSGRYEFEWGWVVKAKYTKAIPIQYANEMRF